jgi:hypothetical protein
MDKTKGKKKAAATFPHIDKHSFRLLPLELPPDPYDSDALPDVRRSRQIISNNFSIKTLCAALHSNCTPAAIKQYIQSHKIHGSGSELLSGEDWPALYYAVRRNSPELDTILLQAGVDARTFKTSFSIPLLAYVIIYGQHKVIDTSEVLKLLLAAGYDPTTIPRDMWQNFLETPTDLPNPSIKIPDDAKRMSLWCTSRVRSILAASLHLTHRYLLHLAYGLASLRPKMIQIAKANKMTEMSKLSYFLVGQHPAVNIVMKNGYSHIALGTHKPLVMAVAGPSGHGKTELSMEDIWREYSRMENNPRSQILSVTASRPG